MTKFKTRKKDGMVFPVDEDGGSASNIESRSSENNDRAEQLLEFVDEVNK